MYSQAAGGVRRDVTGHSHARTRIDNMIVSGSRIIKPCSTESVRYATLVALFVSFAISGTWAQFQFFEQMFGQGHPGQQQRPSSHPVQWASQADASTSQVPAALR